MISRKAFWTILVSGVIAVMLPITLVKVLRSAMAPMITRDNAGIVFAEFQAALQQGSTVRDRITAANVAEQAYREKTSAILLDGWGKRMNIYAVVDGNSCQLFVQSAGPDGQFGGSDDLTIEKTFDLTPAKNRKKPVEPERA